jgi:hypothetical protein
MLGYNDLSDRGACSILADLNRRNLLPLSNSVFNIVNLVFIRPIQSVIVNFKQNSAAFYNNIYANSLCLGSWIWLETISDEGLRVSLGLLNSKKMGLLKI